MALTCCHTAPSLPVSIDIKAWCSARCIFMCISDSRMLYEVTQLYRFASSAVMSEIDQSYHLFSVVQVVLHAIRLQIQI